MICEKLEKQGEIHQNLWHCKGVIKPFKGQSCKGGKPCHWTNWSRKFTFTLLGAHRLWRRLLVCPCCCNWPSPVWGDIHDPSGHVISKPFMGNQGKVIIYLVQSFSLVTIDLKVWLQLSLKEEAISKTSKIFEVWRTRRAG